MDNAEGRTMPYKLLEEITGGFSDDRILSRDKFGVVYKGEDKDGHEITVKLLSSAQDVDDEEFRKGCKNLAKLKHQNIVRLVAFCNDTEHVIQKSDSGQSSIQKMHRALCFDYTENTSLQKYLSGESRGFGWFQQYKIIKGICEGLKYLHTGLENPVCHLDLTPANILIDNNMVPKIAYCGLSALFGTEYVRAVGTIEYMPPEYIKYELISEEFDIYSLGIIILNILTGNMGNSIIDDMKPAELIEHVHNEWRERLQAMPWYPLLKVDCQHVKRCAEIAVKCLEQDRHKRPSIEEIVRNLNETEKIAYVLRSMRIGETDHFTSRRDIIDSGELRQMPYEFLKKITNGFSHDRMLGKGTFGIVYKGEYKDGQEIAVKLLNSVQGVDDNEFRIECENLAKLKHQNIVKLLGFCNETEEALLEHNGKQISALRMHRALCFEYMQNGSLQNHISDESQGFSWHERYKIIIGICEGLNYLQTRLEKPMYHLNLSPDNILLDKNMVPKISDFCLATLLGGESSINLIGACGYMPPEYIKNQEISKEYDIFSLGVIILRTMTGHIGYSIINDLEPAEVIEHVHNIWRERLQVGPVGTSLQVQCKQVKRCVEIAVKCLEEDRHRRPRIGDIVRILHGTKSIADAVQSPATTTASRKELNSWKKPLFSQVVAVQRSMQTGEEDSYMIMDSTGNVEPMHMPHELLKMITDDFSDKKILGKGTFGVVYKGEDKKGQEIAVKVLNSMQGVDDIEFQREFNNLTKLKHPNIVQLVGFCNEEEEVPMEYNGKQIAAVKIHRALCFEYMHNGSLQKHLSDELQGFSWQERYQIIKGICEGLKYLHAGLESPVYHLDLKPDNILLDNNMVPKIADFGLSRLLGEENTKKTMSVVGTLGYMPPEFIRFQIISKEFDIFSLGVIIIRIMIGPRGYSLVCDMDPPEFVEHVHSRWRTKLQAITSGALLELDCQQVKKCIEIALKCIDEKKKRRPSIGYIIDQLNETEKQKNPQASLAEKVGSANCSREMGAQATRGNNTTIERNPLLTTLPRDLPASFLEEITNNFSPERQFDQYISGKVYKGILPDGVVIAVKKFPENSPVANDKAFENEIANLMALEHENIIKLVGYCHENLKKIVEHNGRYVIVDKAERFLCYEYLSNGSLDKYIFGGTNTINWDIRFKIIKGICQGLCYLHRIPLVHMNLVLNNVLLDENFVPKITDFALSRVYGQEQTRVITANVVGQLGYMAPEYIYRGEISTMSDIYSLGIAILEITTGKKNSTMKGDATATRYINKVREIWTPEKIVSNYPSLRANGLRQVQKCIETGLNCVELDRKKRPNMVEIMDILDGWCP